MNKQILEVVSAVSIEKDVDKEIIFEALEFRHIIISEITFKCIYYGNDQIYLICSTSVQRY